MDYVASIAASCQAVWMRKMFAKLMHKQDEATKIYCDNNSVIALSKNHIFHKRSKHIDTSYHFIRELVNNKEICLEFCRSEDQFADIFTKPLARDTFEYLFLRQFKKNAFWRIFERFGLMCINSLFTLTHFVDSKNNSILLLLCCPPYFFILVPFCSHFA